MSGRDRPPPHCGYRRRAHSYKKGLSRNTGRTAKSSRRPGGRRRGVMDDRPAPVRLLRASLRPSAQARPENIHDRLPSNHGQRTALVIWQGSADRHSLHRIWKPSNERARRHMQQMWYSLPPRRREPSRFIRHTILFCAATGLAGTRSASNQRNVSKVLASFVKTCILPLVRIRPGERAQSGLTGRSWRRGATAPGSFEAQSRKGWTI